MIFQTEKDLLVLTRNFPQIPWKSIRIIGHNLCLWNGRQFFYGPVFSSYEGGYKRYHCISRVSDFNIEKVCGWFVESSDNQEVEEYFWCK